MFVVTVKEGRSCSEKNVYISGTTYCISQLDLPIQHLATALVGIRNTELRVTKKKTITAPCQNKTQYYYRMASCIIRHAVTPLTIAN
jgi:hypothetical protein